MRHVIYLSPEMWRCRFKGIAKGAEKNRLLLFSGLREDKSRAVAGASRRGAHVERVMPDPRDLLLKKLPEIERIIAAICRRSGMDADATEEFAAEVRLKLVDNNYAIIRAFQNRSTFEVFIAAVVKRLLIDHRNHKWGKWRTSAEAERLGPLAVELERLLYRDWRTLADAIVVLTGKYDAVSREEIERIAARIPERVRRRSVNIEHASGLTVADPDLNPDRDEMARHISTLVVNFIEGLETSDQAILQLHFDSEMTVAQIARALGIKQALLYRRLYRLFERLRDALTDAGISARDVADLIGKDIAALDFHLKNYGSRPSGKDDDGDESVQAARQEEIP